MAEERIKVLKKATADVRRMFEEFNIKPIHELKYRLPRNNLIDFGVIIAHRDFDIILDEYHSGLKFSVVSGRGPSGPMHFGHLLVFNVVKFLQDLFGANVYIPLSDDEKLVFGKISSLEEGYFWALDNARIILSLGFDKEKTKIYVSSRQKWVYRYALDVSRKLTLSIVKNAFGLDDSHNPGIAFYAAVQIVHILQPTIDTGQRVVVPIALDQDVYMRIARDVAERMRIPKPASLYIRFLPGLNGQPMSSSMPDTAIFVNDSEEKIWHKVMKAFTGGQPTIEEQRREGGNPEKCIVFEWLKAFVFASPKEAEEHAQLCKNGDLVCGFDCKPLLARTLIKLASDIRRRAGRIYLEDFLWEA